VASGFQQTTQGLTIEKDTEAQLVYTFDWVDYLAQGDALSTVSYSITARANDPDPLAIVSQGIQGTKTYVELNNGQQGKSYVVTATITTTDSIIDRRFFRVRVLARSA
jgi:hypothetical protein